MPELQIPSQLSSAFEADADRAGGASWRECSRILYRYLMRDMGDAEDERRRLYPKTGAKHVLRVLPLVYRLAVEVASLYRRPPSRRWVDPETGEPIDDKTAQRIADIYRGAGVDAMLLQAQRMAYATGNAAIMAWPVYKPSVRGARLVLVPPHDCQVELADPLSHDERDLAAFYARLPVGHDPQTGLVRYDVAAISREEAYWSQPDGRRMHRGLFVSEGTRNPIGHIPVCVVRRSPPAVGEFWAPASDDLLVCQRAVNHDLTDIGHFARLQGFSQPVIKADGKVDELEIGPETAVQVDQDGDFVYRSPTPDLVGNQRQIERFIELVVATNGGTPDAIMRSKGITALAKMVERADREQERQDWVMEFQRVEQRVYSLIRRWVNLQRGELLPMARVEVEYRDAWMPADPLHTAQARDLAYQHGTSSPARDVARELGLTLDEARAYVEDNRAEVAALGLTPSTPSRNIDDNGGATRLGVVG